MKKGYLLFLLLASVMPQALAQQTKNIGLFSPYANSICNSEDSINVTIFGISATDTFVVERSFDSVTFTFVDSCWNWNNMVRVSVPSDTVFYRIRTSSDTSNHLRLVKLPPFNVGALTYQGQDSIALCFGSLTPSLSPTIVGARGLYSFGWQRKSTSGDWQTCNSISSTLEGVSLYRQFVSNVCGSGTTDSFVVKIHPHIADSIVSGETVCYSAIPDALSLIGASSNYAYQWMDSVTNWQARMNDTLSMLSFNAPLVEDRYFQLVITDTVSQCQSQSNIVYIHVIAPITIPEIIGYSSDTTVCYNTPVSLAIPASTAENVSYQWEKNEGGGWITIAGAQDTSYDTTLATTVSFRIRLTNTCDTVYSNTVSFLVLRQYSSPSIVATEDTICNGTNTILRLTWPTPVDTPDITYSWIFFSGNAINPTGSENVDTFATGNLIENTLFGIYVNSAHGCISGIDSSSVITVYVRPEMQSGSLSDGQSICFKDRPDTIIQTTPFCGGSGIFNYQWESRSKNVTIWDTILNENGTSYRPSVLRQSTYYRLVGQDAVCGEEKYTDSIYIHVYDSMTAPHIYIPQQGDTSVCYATAPDLLYVDTLAHGGGSISYYWESSSDDTNWSILNGEFDTIFQPDALTTTTLFHIVAQRECGSDTSNTYLVNVYPRFVAGSISANDTLVCYRTSTHLQFDSLPHGGHNGYSVEWQWSTDGLEFHPITGSNTISNNTELLDSSRFYRAVATSEYCQASDTTNTIRIYVREPLVGAQLADETEYICFGDSLNHPIIATPAHGGEEGIYSYKWLVSSDPTSGFSDASYYSTNSTQFTPSQIPYSFNYYKIQTYNLCDTVISYNAHKIAVDPLPKNPTIFGDTANLCNSQEPVRYWVAPDENLSCHWTASNGEITAGRDSSVVFVLWSDSLSNAELFLQVTDNSTGCYNANYHAIDIDLTDHAPKATQIKVKKGGNILICAEDSSAAIYEWGFTQNSTGIYTAIENSNHQYVQLPAGHTFNPAMYTYSVTVWYSGSKCQTTSYYMDENAPESSAAPQTVSMTVSPNPSHGEVFISLDADIDGRYTIGVFDAVGQPVYSKEYFDYVKNTLLKIDKQLHPGIYIVSVSTNNSVFNQKIIVR